MVGVVNGSFWVFSLCLYLPHSHLLVRPCRPHLHLFFLFLSLPPKLKGCLCLQMHCDIEWKMTSTLPLYPHPPPPLHLSLPQHHPPLAPTACRKTPSSSFLFSLLSFSSFSPCDASFLFLFLFHVPPAFFVFCFSSFSFSPFPSLSYVSSLFSFLYLPGLRHFSPCPSLSLPILPTIPGAVLVDCHPFLSLCPSYAPCLQRCPTVCVGV